jgi:hypothetical protein
MTPEDLEKYRETLLAAGIIADGWIPAFSICGEGALVIRLLELAHKRGEKIKEMEKRIEVLESDRISLRDACQQVPWTVRDNEEKAISKGSAAYSAEFRAAIIAQYIGEEFEELYLAEPREEQE